MKVMISQGMKGKTDEQIKNERKKIIRQLEEMHITVVDTIFKDDFDKKVSRRPAVKYLSKSIDILAEVDAVLFMDGWENYRGCCVEHEICKQYDIKILYEDFFVNKENKSVTSHITIQGGPITTLPYYPDITRTIPVKDPDTYKITCSNNDVARAMKNEVEELL